MVYKWLTWLILTSAYGAIACNGSSDKAAGDDDASISDTSDDTGQSNPLSCDGAIQFSDANLEAVVREAIAKPADDIEQDDVAGLTELDGHFKDISDLTGLQCLAGLVDLTLSANSISDITPLSGLTALTVLHLYENNITDIAPLAGLTGLDSLGLHENNISDIFALTGLTNLTYLSITENNVSDISALVENQGIDRDDDVWILSNPIDCNDPTVQEHISTLEGRGVNLEHDCI